MIRAVLLLIPLGLLALFALPAATFAQDEPQSFEEAVVDVGRVGLTITNTGYIGRPNVRNLPAGPPSFEYPLESGVEHLFDAGLWVGGIRSDGSVRVRTGAVTAPGGYSPGDAGYEFAPTPSGSIVQRSTLPGDYYRQNAVSHQDFVTEFADTLRQIPRTSIQMPDYAGRLGLVVQLSSYAWDFPFADDFVILNFEITNTDETPIDSVYVGMYHDLVVRNVNTTTESGSDFFNKGGLGSIDSLHTTYAFNAGGQEQSLNTYGAITFLGAEWTDPQTNSRRFFHPNVADRYAADGYPEPHVNFRWWSFSTTVGFGDEDPPQASGNPQQADARKYRYMSTPYPNPAEYGCAGTWDTDCNDPDYLADRQDYRERVRTGGLTSQGNWIGMTSVGPFPTLAPGETIEFALATVGALKPEPYQDGLDGRPLDTPLTREQLIENIQWARRTYAGEDADYDGELDPGEDLQEVTPEGQVRPPNNQLDRYRVPTSPPSPRVRVNFESASSGGRQDSRVVLYWNQTPESAFDPITAEEDFEGYRIYRTNPGDDLTGDIQTGASLIAQYDRPGNSVGFNNGFETIRIADPDAIPNDASDVYEYTADGRTYYAFTFADDQDTTRYAYRYVADDLLSGWQYLFAVTSFDRGDRANNIASLESGRSERNSARVFPGTPAASPDSSRKVGVYPNPYRAGAAWDGPTSRTRRLNFYNLPARCDIRIYSLAGEIVAELHHGEDDSDGIRWHETYSTDNRRVAGGEASWDILSENSLDIATGLYLFTVEDLDTGEVHRGKFVVIK